MNHVSNHVGRTIAIGDIHGCSAALAALIDVAQVSQADTVVTLGDYVGKGLDSCGVIEFLVDLRSRCNLVPLLGNHDQLMLGTLDGEMSLETWTMFGGETILRSYGARNELSIIPQSHYEFLRSCLMYYETETHILTHACYDPESELAATDVAILLLEKIGEELPLPHRSGKIAIVGHTSQKSGEVLDGGHIICIDTSCWSGGWLTAMELESGTTLQADRNGTIRY